MPTRTEQNVTVRAGETRPIEMTVRDEDGADIDVSGEHIVYRIARHGRSKEPSYLVDLDENSAQITINDNGAAVFSVVRYDPGLSDLVIPGKHFHQLAIVQSGSDARVVLEGTFTIKDAIVLPR
jgi:hypothetical protein